MLKPQIEVTEKAGAQQRASNAPKSFHQWDARLEESLDKVIWNRALRGYW